ncbi:MAG: DUF2207 domain-containing protein [Deferribacterales bacterium]
MRAVLSLILLALTVLPAFGEDFVIKKHDVNINVLETSVLEVTETYLISFRQPRRGIILELPRIYEAGSIKGTAKRPNIFGGRYRILIDDIQTKSAEIKVTDSGAYREVRLGSPDQYIKGEKEYVVSYRVFGAVNFFGRTSEIYWNIHGNFWDVPAESVAFSVHLPSELPLGDDEIFAYTGYYGEAGTDASYSYDGRTLSGSAERTLNPGESLSIGILLPGNYLKYGTPWLRLRLFIANNSYLIALFVYLPLLFLIWYKKGRDASSVLVTLYEPPAGVSPAVAGVLADDKIDNRDLVSVFLKWAADKVIRIEEAEDYGSFLGKSDYIFVKLGELPEGAPAYEQTLFTGMFPAGLKNRRLSDLKNVYYKTMGTAREQLDKDVASMGLYEGGTRKIGGFMKGASLVFIFFGVFLTAFSGDAGWFVSCVLMGAATFFFGRAIPKRTAKGQGLYNKLAGFKEFVERAEKDRLERMLEKNPEYFNLTVPYAVAFGMLKEWAGKFEGLLREPPDWYVSRSGRGFTMYGFADSLNSGISAMSRTMTSQPAPQGGAGGGGSGFSGGGFSGGGFGGGGGRSW